MIDFIRRSFLFGLPWRCLRRRKAKSKARKMNMLRLTYVSCAAYIKRLLEKAATAELRVVTLAFCPVPTHTASTLSAFSTPKSSHTTPAIHICFIKFHNSSHSRRRRADKFIFSSLLNFRFFLRLFAAEKKRQTAFLCVKFLFSSNINGHKITEQHHDQNTGLINYLKK